MQAAPNNSCLRTVPVPGFTSASSVCSLNELGMCLLYRRSDLLGELDPYIRSRCRSHNQQRHRRCNRQHRVPRSQRKLKLHPLVRWNLEHVGLDSGSLIAQSGASLRSESDVCQAAVFQPLGRRLEDCARINRNHFKFGVRGSHREQHTAGFPL